MNKFIKLIALVSVINFNFIKSTNIYHDIFHPVYASYYYDIGENYLKTGERETLLPSKNGKRNFFTTLEKPRKKRINNGLLSKLGIGKTYQRIILISRNEKRLKGIVPKSKVIKSDYANQIVGQDPNSILAIHPQTNKDYICVKEIATSILQVSKSGICSYWQNHNLGKNNH